MQQPPQRVETLIIGAGVIGSSLAMHLAKLGMTGIRVVDFDLEGPLSSSELNAGGVRATLAHPLNIEMSKLSIDYFAAHAEEVGYRACGYLWLHGAERLPGAMKARELQQSMGWDVQAWDVAELRRRVPFLDKTDDIAAAIFAPRDGLVNPNLLKNHFRKEARARGVVFDDRTLVRAAERSRDGQARWKVTAEKFRSGMETEEKIQILSKELGASIPELSGYVEYEAKRMVNCAGPWASEIARVFGYVSPTFNVRRQISIFDCRDVDLTPFGMIIDTSGVYFHPEATNGLAGYADHEEPRGINYRYDGEAFFMERIWPALYERSSAFERLRHLTGWAGLYEVSPDESAILGPAAGALGDTVFEAHSFSGHGVMHSYAAGLVLAERMVNGKFQTMDAEAFTAERFESGRLISERLVI